jgi:hypothetical protein
LTLRRNMNRRRTLTYFRCAFRRWCEHPIPGSRAGRPERGGLGQPSRRRRGRVAPQQGSRRWQRRECDPVARGRTVRWTRPRSCCLDRPIIGAHADEKLYDCFGGGRSLPTGKRVRARH